MDADLRCFCDSLHKSYGATRVLHGCNLMVREGEMVGLVGENGSGKSTLVQCLLGFVRPSRGKVWVTSSVGYCPQLNYLHRRITVAEHFALMKAVHRGFGIVDDQFLFSLLENLKLGSHLQTRIGHLSSGTYQKVKFVTAIAHRPAMVILDEPCDGFDWAMYQAFWEIMAHVKYAGSSVLMISHFLYDRERFDRIYELKEGVCDQAA